MTSPNLVQGQLSLGSYIKLFVIGSIGILPVMAIICGIVILIKCVRGDTINLGDGVVFPFSDLWHFWPVALVMVLFQAVSIVMSGAFLGLCSYPYYAWLCRRRMGVILRGKFEVIL
jgi:hypothetical protein